MQESLDCSLDQFADDSMLHDCGDTMDKVIASLQRNTLEIENYSICNSVTIHPDKYVKSIIISKQRFIDLLPKIEINGQCIIIAVVKASKCLGITIDQELSWEAHIQSTSKNFSGKIKKTISNEIITGIYDLHYLPSTIMARLDKVYIRAARFINKVKKSVPDNLILQHIGWCPLTTYYKRSLACKTWKILNNLSSPLLYDLITKKKSTREKPPPPNSSKVLFFRLQEILLL